MPMSDSLEAALNAESPEFCERCGERVCVCGMPLGFEDAPVKSASVSSDFEKGFDNGYAKGVADTLAAVQGLVNRLSQRED